MTTIASRTIAFRASATATVLGREGRSFDLAVDKAMPTAERLDTRRATPMGKRTRGIAAQRKPRRRGGTAICDNRLAEPVSPK
jgi:hypothetical protein